MPRLLRTLKSCAPGLLATGLAVLSCVLLHRLRAAGLDGAAVIGFALAIVIEPKA